MKKILVTGSNGQIGVELVQHLRKIYGSDNVVATARKKVAGPVSESGPFAFLDARDGKAVGELLDSWKIDTVIHLAGILSARGEADPQLAWDTNMNGLYTMLEAARPRKCAFFFPSSIAAFGPGTPTKNTPQDTIQRPSTIYGVTKVAGELLCDYYHLKYGLDTRGLRFPGLISYSAPPGGGTTDYAVHIYYEAAATGRYTSYIGKGSFMDMMYMPDALDAVARLMEADPSKLRHRSAFNISAMSFDPEGIAASIRKVIPKFELSYKVDPVRQAIADSWPDSLDCSAAKEEWGFAPRYDLDAMTRDMLERVSKP
ncbi:MAG: NAD-dependent epimerase/dehydratase family protein [Synergistaceae bacterium]|jgi:nucleoside-diphosphate-sugar epimerase|nr:NAD-dependent epimerase/dehydratase family protein [Synergistaceae bacterium]